VGRILYILGTIMLVLIGVVLSIPILLRPSRLPYEPAAVANLRTINTAQVTYLSNLGGNYGSMTDLIAAKLLDDTFAGTKAGYKFSITLGATGSDYTAEAVPVVPASTKTTLWGYYSFPDAVVRYSTNASLAPAGQSGRSVQ
jgi:hypothetical protein